MREISPGLWHWTSEHPHIHKGVSSYWLADEHVLLDPMLPAEGPDWFPAHGGAPEHVLLTNRHHDRDAWALRERFGCAVHCPQAGVHEVEGRGPVEAYAPGDTLPGGAVAHEVGAICPDEMALHLPAHRALAVADGIIRWNPEDDLSFVPDSLMDDPEATKTGLRAAYTRLLELDFDTLLLAHGGPEVGDGKAALRAFLDRTA
jgi:hypothetical protein